MKRKHVHHLTFDKLICAISIICLGVVLVLVLVLKDSLRTYLKSLFLSWSLRVRSLSLSLVGQVQEILVFVLVLGVRSLSLSWSLGVRFLSLPWSLQGGQVLVNIPDENQSQHYQHHQCLCLDLSGRITTPDRFSYHTVTPSARH